tara:strand:+ start:229 stop:645 length:417 start_codon:yes stop_codon:yes gene_type:complete
MSKRSLLKKFNINYLNSFNNNKLIVGLGMLIVTLFSKYLVFNISKSQEEFIKNTLSKEILIFITLFIGTRDIIISLFLTGIVIIFSNTLFNHNSNFCIIPEKYKYLNDTVDNDNKLTDEEMKKVINILHKSNENLQKN